MESSDICIILTLVCIGAIILACMRKLPPTKPIRGRKKLVVTAHPDDECMFFGPFIAWEVSQGTQVHLLCLSKGDYKGKGPIRCEEIRSSCNVFGIPEKFCCIFKSTVLIDDPNCRWDTVEIKRAVYRYCNQHEIDVVVSFDSDGVSGHANHVAVFNALSELSKSSEFTQEIFVLESVSVLRKYFLSLDLCCLFFQNPAYVYSLDLALRDRPHRAMMHYVSQLTWYRYLYLWFSRYMIVNTFKHIQAASKNQSKQRQS